jgi:hypothetical protein
MLTYYNQLSCGLVIKINLINMLQAWHMWSDVSNQAGCRGYGSLAGNNFCGVSFVQRKPLMGFLRKSVVWSTRLFVYKSDLWQILKVIS